MLNLLSFAETEGQSTGGSGWGSIIILVVLLVGMVLLMIIPQRKQRKQAEEMMSKLAVGCVVTTIGGIIGEVVALDDKNIWIQTGLDENKCVMQFLRQAVHSVAPAGSTTSSTEQKSEDEVDEIK